jgi:uracil-DNA glycosylase family 4
MDANKLAYLQALDIPVWMPKTQEAGSQPPAMNTLKQCVLACQRCRLSKTRTQTVFGIGNEQADVMVIGEAPGFHEDQQGEPFVGRAGQLLNAMLLAIGLTREQVFIANIIKCRPPNNRDPLPDEVETCTEYLVQQIDFIKPKVICALGRISAQYLLKREEALGKLRQQTHHYQNIPLIATYHPAYLLRNPIDKKKTYQDLLTLKGYVSC